MDLGVHRDSCFENRALAGDGELLVDVVDSGWANETLPIDDIPLPEGLRLPNPYGVGESDEHFVELPDPHAIELSSWTELNLDRFH